MIVALYFTKNDKLKCNNMKSRVLFEAQECNKYEISKWDNIKRGKFLWVPHASFHEFLMQVSTSSLKKKKKKNPPTLWYWRIKRVTLWRGFWGGFLLQELCSESSLPTRRSMENASFRRRVSKGLMEMCPWLLGRQSGLLSLSWKL